MKKKAIKIKFQNGLAFESFKREVFEVNKLTEDFEFIESDQPDFIVFGPYGNDIPKEGNHIRIGYFCENIIPDFSICDWAFGMPSEQIIKNPKYKKIQWHGFNPQLLIKSITENDIDRIVDEKKKFCNFLYGNQVPYREEFFKQLSKYKKIDAPGRSMNNMSSIDSLYAGDVWDRKRQFLNQYKFTIAFENYSYSGYHTEKLFDSMLVKSLPIYCGDPQINEVFNTNSFINTSEYAPVNNGIVVKGLEKLVQWNFVDIRPSFYHTPIHRTSRKLKSLGRKLKMKLQYSNYNFKDLIDRIVEIDKDQDLYVKYLLEPWFGGNVIPENTISKQRWSEIFNSI